LSNRFRFKITLENHYPHPAVFPTARRPVAVQPSSILHMTFRTASLEGCKAAVKTHPERCSTSTARPELSKTQAQGPPSLATA